MMQLLTVLMALFPVFLVILTGFFLKERGLFEESDQKGIEKLTYHVFFPAVVILSLVRVNLSDLPVTGVGFALAGTVLLLTPLLFILKRFFKIAGSDFTSLFQGTVRWNSFVAIALCGSLYGARGTAISAIATLALIPLVNILGVMILSHYGTKSRLTFKAILLTLLKNPFIWSSILGLFLGLFLSLLALPLPQWLLIYGDMLGAAALATGLLIVGMGLQVKSLKRIAPLSLLSLFLKLIISPLFVAILASFMGVTGIDFAAMMICASVPTASASYILARQMGGNAPLMAEMITLQTVVAGLTLPFWVWFS